MNKKELINNISNKMKISKSEIEKIINEGINCFKESLRIGEDIKLSGLGKFSLKLRNARFGINPSTKEKIFINQKYYINFKNDKKIINRILN